MRQICNALTGCLAAALIASAGCSKKPDVAGRAGLTGTITISGAWALYPMVVKWAEEFRKIHPGVTIDISAGGAGKGMADALSGTADLGMVSRAINPVELGKGAWHVSVVKDAVVPTINSANPAAGEILKRGLTRGEFEAIWIKNTLLRWDSLLAAPDRELPIHVYTRSDACGAAETWAQYLGGNQQDLQAVGVYGDPGLAETVRKDTLGIGYNNINFVYDSKTRRPVEGLEIIPLDMNGNHVVDREESFYSNLDDLIKAIGDGRYPSPPARPLHLVSGGPPKKTEVREFLRWILSDGQNFAEGAGYIGLPREQMLEQMKKLDAAK